MKRHSNKVKNNFLSKIKVKTEADGWISRN
jgi:hypothetical protein